MAKIIRWTFKYNEVLFIIVGLLISGVYAWYGDQIRAHAFAYEKLGKVVFGIAMYFIVEGVNRIHFIAQYKRLYKYFDSSFKENKQWENIPESQRPWLAAFVFVFRLLAMAILISAL